jgi:murein DD-endopeptidase MepM/ murein hydrolase activator NlpD
LVISAALLARRLVRACAVVVLAGSVAVSAADDTSEEFAAPSPGADEASKSVTSGSASLTIEKPVGRMRLARVGDELGVRRFEARSTQSTAATIFFSDRPVRVGSSIAGPASMPSGMPLTATRLTSQFGYRFHPMSGRYQPHAGIDLAAPAGTSVMATGDGTVNIAGWMGGYGLVVQIDHGGAVETRYAHLSRLAVASGQSVKRGQIIGFVGSTGRSTGPHLHYEVRQSDVAVNPLGQSAK